jgi:hypothetical protein
VLARATSATPTDRYNDAGELLAALETSVDAAIHVGRPGAATSTSAVKTSDTVHGPTAPTDGGRIAPARTPLANAGRTGSNAKTRVFTRSRYGLPVALAAGVALIVVAGGYRLATSVDPAPPASTSPHGLVGFTPPPPSTGSAEAPPMPEPAIAPAASPSHPAGQGRTVAPAVRPAGSHASTAPPAVPTATRARWAAVGVGAVGVAGIAVGSVFGAMAFSKWGDAQSQARSTATFGQANNTESTGKSDATVSTVAFIAGGLLAAGGVVLFVVSPSKGSGASATVAPTLGGLTVVGTF